MQVTMQNFVNVECGEPIGFPRQLVHKPTWWAKNRYDAIADAVGRSARPVFGYPAHVTELCVGRTDTFCHGVFGEIVTHGVFVGYDNRLDRWCVEVYLFWPEIASHFNVPGGRVETKRRACWFSVIAGCPVDETTVRKTITETIADYFNISKRGD